MLAPGDVIDGFRIVRSLHVGGMAMLWIVEHDDHQGPLLMKVPRLGEGEDPAAIVSFEMEQMIMPRLAGPHVPKFVAAGDFAVLPYIVMEFVEGVSLAEVLPKLPLPIDEVATIGAAIAAALDDIHRQQIVHLDIKPGNILLRSSGSAVLVDFGLSTHAALPDLMEEEFRLPYGSAPYMAPEQVLGERRDPASDLFALGAVLYHLVTGQTPFGDPQRMAGLRRRLWRDPTPPRKLRPEIPGWLQEVILRCLSIDPAMRHPTAAQLAFDLSHPDQVALTERAVRSSSGGMLAAFRRRLAAPRTKPARRRNSLSISSPAPILAVAVDLDEGSATIAASLREQVARILRTMPQARLACLNVLKIARLTIDTALDEESRNKHVQRLVGLRHRADELKLDPARITFHVLEATAPADAILEYVVANRVDHVVLGARTKSLRKSLLGSVSAAVAAQAPCTVTIARSRSAYAE
ncbi:MAG: protein kinase [Alphaproteobacteria bacterium]|nr:protein kinase [Alphaproteobacteria bacterium]